MVKFQTQECPGILILSFGSSTIDLGLWGQEDVEIQKNILLPPPYPIRISERIIFVFLENAQHDTIVKSHRKKANKLIVQ